MAALSAAQIARVAYGAGFRGVGLQRAVAVALAESAGNPNAVGHNSDSHHSRDRGLWQINSYWHREVSDAAAFNPATAAKATFRISKGGKDWSQWSTWKNGSAQANMGRAKMAVARAGLGGSKGKADAGSSPTVTIIGADGKAHTTSNTTGHVVANPAGIKIPGPGLVPNFGDLFGGGAAGGAAKDLFDIGTTPIRIMVKGAAWVSDPHNWARVAMVTGGTVGVILGMYALGQSGAAGSTAGKALTMPVRAAKASAKEATKAASLAALA